MVRSVATCWSSPSHVTISSSSFCHSARRFLSGDIIAFELVQAVRCRSERQHCLYCRQIHLELDLFDVQLKRLFSALMPTTSSSLSMTTGSSSMAGSILTAATDVTASLSYIIFLSPTLICPKFELSATTSLLWSTILSSSSIKATFLEARDFDFFFFFFFSFFAFLRLFFALITGTTRVRLKTCLPNFGLLPSLLLLP